jgi:hypothetical protein
VAVFWPTDSSTLETVVVELVEKSAFVDSGRSRVETGERGTIPSERQHPKVGDWESRPRADVQVRDPEGRLRRKGYIGLSRSLDAPTWTRIYWQPACTNQFAAGPKSNRVFIDAGPR